MKVLISCFIVIACSRAWADSTHNTDIIKSYALPVSSSQVLIDLEAEAKRIITSTCNGHEAFAKKFIVSIPFDTSDFSFYSDGVPGSTTKPVFMYWSYPTASAVLEFVCRS